MVINDDDFGKLCDKYDASLINAKSEGPNQAHIAGIEKQQDMALLFGGNSSQ